MTFTIPAQDLLRAARRAATICRKVKSLPFTTALRLEAQDDLLTIVADTMEMRLASATWGEGTLPPVIVSAPALLGLLTRRLDPGGTAALSVAGEDDEAGALTLRLGLTEAVLPGVILPQDFPEPRSIIAPTSATVPALLLKQALRRCLPAVSTEETRYYLNGVFFDAEGGRLRTVATNRHRLIFCDPPEAPAWPLAPFILPRDAARTLLREDLLGDDTVEVEACTVHCRVALTGDGWSLAANTIDGKFPNYRGLLDKVPAPDAPAIRVGAPAEWSQAMRMLAAGGLTRGRAVQLLNGTGDALRLMVRGEGESVGVTLRGSAWATPGEHPVTGFQARYLVELAEAMPEGFTLRLPADPARGGPAIAEAAGVRGLLMPMRV